MNDTEKFLEWFKARSYRVTLGEIMRSEHGCEYRKHFTLLRKRGLDIRVQSNRKEPSLNLYTLAGAEAQTAKTGGPVVHMPPEANLSGSCDGGYPNSTVSPSAPVTFDKQQAVWPDFVRAS